MIWLDPRQWILLLLLGVSAVVGFKFWEHRLESRGYDRATAEYSVRAIKAAKEAAERTTRLQEAVDEAERKWNSRNIEQRRAADRLRAERDGLRIDLRTARERLNTDPVEAVRQYAATATTVLEQCVARYAEVAEAADGHASDSLKLQESWPR